jgi:predicted GIY-YIG superfamily endonuclease
MNWSVYILRCANDSYYVGHSTNADRRLLRHIAGTAAQHTAIYCPERILYQERFDTEAEAVHRERQIKRWSRAKKEALIAGDANRLRALSRSYD